MSFCLHCDGGREQGRDPPTHATPLSHGETRSEREQELPIRATR